MPETDGISKADYDLIGWICCQCGTTNFQDDSCSECNHTECDACGAEEEIE